MARIQLLPPQLANQIAAGEVVERPSSVVKELLENSLDAQATQIEIEIEQGGRRLIRIRDNGIGIHPDDLGLALLRHATSKLFELSDLECVTSLGFRGEALASMSSVSRLILSSCTAETSTGWQVTTDGCSERPQMKPIAHPRGTTVEVYDLFFNTPARRKFMRSEYTEWTHVLEIVKRIVLSRFDVAWTLKHQQRLIYQLSPAHDDAAKLRRIATLCSPSFVEQALSIDAEKDDLRLIGWIGLPHTSKAPDVHYFYVNGRMVRDKLIYHAIRQAYQTIRVSDEIPAFILYFTLDPSSVDVNAHPTKHEVRFRESRFVHDFIVKVIVQALSKAAVETTADNLSGIPVVKESSTRSYGVSASHAYQSQPPIDAYQALYRPLEKKISSDDDIKKNTASVSRLGTPVSYIYQRYAVCQLGDGLIVIDLLRGVRELLNISTAKILMKTLLIPVVIDVDETKAQCVETQQASFLLRGFHLTRVGTTQLLVKAIPKFLQVLSVNALVNLLLSHENKEEFSEICAKQRMEYPWSLPEIDDVLQQFDQISDNLSSRFWVQWSEEAVSALFLPSQTELV